MSTVIIIESKKESNFNSEAKIILEGKKFAEVTKMTFMGAKTGAEVTQELTNLESYKKNKSQCGISIYYGTVAKK